MPDGMADRHRIGRLSLDASVANLDTALEMRGRLETLAQNRLPGVIERVLDELGLADSILAIERLDLDLGVVRAEQMEGDVIEAFEAALAEALRDTLASARHGPSRTAQLMRDGDWQAQRLETYLASGVLPSTAGDGRFLPAAAIAELLARDPRLVLALLSRLRHDSNAIKRLVLQAGEELLVVLLERLAPADARAILELFVDLTAAYRATPPRDLPPSGESALRRLWWVTTLEFLLRDPGTQFNRRRFLAHLLTREARRLGISYAALLRILRATLRRTRTRTGLHASLPIVLEALLDEENLRESKPDQLAEQVRSAAVRGGEAALRRLVSALSPNDFSSLLRKLAPAVARQAEAEYELLVTLHRLEPWWPGDTAMFAARLRAILCLALTGSTAQGSWRNVLLSRLARAAGTTTERMQRRLAAALVSQNRDPLGLARLLASELAEIRRTGSPDDFAGASIAALIRDPAALYQWAFRHPAAARADALSALAPIHAAEALRIVDALAALHARDPLPGLDARIEPLVWTLAARYLGELGTARFDARALTRIILDELIRTASPASSALSEPLRTWAQASNAPAHLRDWMADQELIQAPGPSPEWQALESYLRSGSPEGAARALPALAGSEPTLLAGLITRLANSGAVPLDKLAERLLSRLLPAELLPGLAPLSAAAVLRWADATGGLDGHAWRALVVDILRDELPVLPLPPRSFGTRLDRLAALSHRLHHGTAPWWERGLASPAARAAELGRMPLSDFIWLLKAGDLAQTSARIEALLALIPRGARVQVLTRLMPKVAPGGDTEVTLATLAAAAAATIFRGVGQVTASDVSGPNRQDLRSGAPVSRAALLAWLDGASSASSAMQSARLLRLYAALMDRGDSALMRLIVRGLQTAATRKRWSEMLPPEALGRLVAAALPGQAADHIAALRLLDAAQHRNARFGVTRLTTTQLWELLLEQVALPGSNLARTVAVISTAMAGGSKARAAQLRRSALALARQGGQVPLITALQREEAAAMRDPAAAAASTRRDPPPSDPSPPAAPEPEPEPDPKGPEHSIYIGNAGLVLLHNYLPVLFDRLGVLGEDDRGRPCLPDLERRSRAVHALQYLVDERTDRPEPALALNKLLCGIAPVEPILPEVELDVATRSLCDGLLQAAIAAWTIIENSSISAMRETFLQREGRLTYQGEQWDLHIERSAVDVLVDRIPWSFSMIYHRWMPLPLRVTW